jgi:hypothetical protein
MLTRRDLIAKAAVGAAAAVAVGAVRTGFAATRPLDDPSADPARPDPAAKPEPVAKAEPAAKPDAPAPQKDAAPPPWGLVAPFTAGTVVAHGWRLVDLSPVRDGSTVVTLQNQRGRAHRVHLCRNDGSPQGLVYTRRIDLVVMNQGYGDLPTEEHFGQAVAKLAHAVAANEAALADEVFAALSPHAARVERFAAVVDASADGRLR